MYTTVKRLLVGPAVSLREDETDIADPVMGVIDELPQSHPDALESGPSGSPP